jgi:hypothetical protein
MDWRVTDAAWFDDRTEGAPPVLRERVRAFFDHAPQESRPARLAAAGRSALHAAIAAGDDRGAALDLLAADALITLALLSHAEDDPLTLGTWAGTLRAQMVAA